MTCLPTKNLPGIGWRKFQNQNMQDKTGLTGTPIQVTTSSLNVSATEPAVAFRMKLKTIRQTMKTFPHQLRSQRSSHPFVMLSFSNNLIIKLTFGLPSPSHQTTRPNPRRIGVTSVILLLSCVVDRTVLFSCL